jgi:uncharacterized protein with HEPN domain
MKKDDFEFITHMLESIEAIEHYTKNLSKDEFIKNEEKTDAVVMRVAVIGEAAKSASQDFRDDHKEINWRELAGLRDIVVHQYFYIDLNIIWEVVTLFLPKIKSGLIKLRK